MTNKIRQVRVCARFGIFVSEDAFFSFSNPPKQLWEMAKSNLEDFASRSLPIAWVMFCTQRC